MTMKIRLKMKDKSQRCDINRPRSRHGHKYTKYKKCLSVLSNTYATFEAHFITKLKKKKNLKACICFLPFISFSKKFLKIFKFFSYSCKLQIFLSIFSQRT